MKLEIIFDDYTGEPQFKINQSGIYGSLNIGEMYDVVNAVNIHEELIEGIKYALNRLENCPNNTGDEGDQAYQTLKELVEKIK